MNKKQFMRRLKISLRGLPRDEVNASLVFYDEVIADHMESGLPEAEAVAAVGTPEEAAYRIIADLPEDVQLRMKKNSRIRRMITMPSFVLGLPLWIALLAVAFSLLISLLAVWVSVVISLFAVALALAAGLVVCLWLAFTAGYVYVTLVWIGFAMVCAGLAPISGWCGFKLAKLAAVVFRRGKR